MAAVGSQLKKSSVGGSGRSKEGEMPDEEQLELSMKQLNLLHIKVRKSFLMFAHLLDWKWSMLILPYHRFHIIVLLTHGGKQCRELRTTIQRMLEAIPNNSTGTVFVSFLYSSLFALGHADTW